MSKLDVFEKELLLIKNERYLRSLKQLLSLLPEYFYSVPASSTGKYHPSYALGEGGLVRHTKVCLKIASDLLADKAICNFTSDEGDLILVALFLHDGLKHGMSLEKYSRVDHPLLIGDFILTQTDNLEFTVEEINFIVSGVKSHMGPWNKDKDGKEIIPLPKNKYERFIHMCDYLASRKYLEVVFDDDNIIG